MRRTLLPLCLCAALLLTGCGAEAETSPPEPERSRTVTLVEEPLALPQFEGEESARMACYMAANRALVDGETLYTLDFDALFRPVLARYQLSETGLSGYEILAEDCAASYLCLYQDALYYLSEGRIERLNLSDGEREVLVEGPCLSLQLADGMLYYRDAQGSFCRIRPDGSSQTVLLRQPCDYAYVLGELLLYQSETDGLRLHLRELDGTRDELLSEEPAYAPLLLGPWLYYSSVGSLVRMDAATRETRSFDLPPLRGEAEFFCSPEDWVARIGLDDGGVGQALLTLGEEARLSLCGYQGYRLCDFVSETLRVDAMYEADGRLRCFALCAYGRELRYFGGALLP